MFEAKFQSFTDTERGVDTGAKLKTLRARLSVLGLDGFIVPRADEHQNEYVAPCSERLAWLTGFSGSAGVAVVLKKEAAIFVDGRYVLQVKQEIDAKLFAAQELTATPPARWLADRVERGARIGYDPLVHTNRQIDAFAKALAAKRAELVPIEPNPIDEIWTDRPAAPLGPVWLHPTRLAGKSVLEKLAELRRVFAGANALLLSDPHSIAWTFNIRGSDVAHTPIALAFALIPARGAPTLYVDGRKIRGEVREALEKILVIAPAQNLRGDLVELGEKRKTVLFDQATAPVLLVEALREAGGKPRLVEDPAALPKAVKNPRELAGIRTAHVRDGAALTRFLAWFEKEAVKGELTEIAAAQALETFRRESGLLRDISFPTISAFGPHAAIPHYRVTERSNLKIERGIYLVDSGGQYLDGTTDVTRTVAVGYAARPVREHFTRVLKGHIAIAAAVFPKGVTGAQLDAMARRPLWEAGLDFDHSVGHGVGAYLGVHEGPQRIAKMGHTPLEPGMILSNEPGYYRAGEYGIRLENLVVVERREIKGAEREMLGFETITLAPFDLNLVEPSLLAPEEADWLNAYHARVRNTLSPLVDVETRSWLKKATRRLSR